MKKLISFVLSLTIVFSLCAFANVSATSELELESVCNNVYKTFEFKQDNYNKEYSSDNAELQFNEDGSMNVKFKENIQECLLLFNVENANEIGDVLNEEKYGFKPVTNYEIYADFSLKSKIITGSSNVMVYMDFCNDLNLDSRIINHTTLVSEPYTQRLYLTKFQKDYSAAKYLRVVFSNLKSDLTDSEITVSPLICRYGFAEHNIIIVGKEAPTCTQAGSSGKEYCTECKCYFSNSVAIKPIFHNRLLSGVVKPTYFKAGYTGDVKCTICGEVLSYGEKIAIKKLQKPTISKISKGKKQFTVKFKKVTGAQGYEVSVYKNGKWTKFTTKKLKYTVKKLIKGKTYKVKIRAFVKQGKQTKYSKDSATKKVKL